MNGSRRKRNRKDKRRRKQLREKSLRLASKEGERFTEKKPSFGERLERNQFGIFLGVLVLIGIGIVLSLGPDKHALKELSRSFDPILNEHALDWDLEFTGGYEILALSDQKIVPTTFNTLPAELDINWDDIGIRRIQAAQLNDVVETVQIALKNIKYPPANVEGKSVTVTLSRQVGSSARIMVMGDREFIVRIVEDHDGYLFCLFGLKQS